MTVRDEINGLQYALIICYENYDNLEAQNRKDGSSAILGCIKSISKQIDRLEQTITNGDYDASGSQ